MLTSAKFAVSVLLAISNIKKIIIKKLVIYVVKNTKKFKKLKKFKKFKKLMVLK